MTLTEIKKELYKQKPYAEFNSQNEFEKIYSGQINTENGLKVLFFKIPLNECDFQEVVPAQLLIRWIVQ